MIIDLDRDFLLHGTVFSHDGDVRFEVEHGVVVGGEKIYLFRVNMTTLLEGGCRRKVETAKAREMIKRMMR